MTNDGHTIGDEPIEETPAHVLDAPAVDVEADTGTAPDAPDTAPEPDAPRLCRFEYNPNPPGGRRSPEATRKAEGSRKRRVSLGQKSTE